MPYPVRHRTHARLAGALSMAALLLASAVSHAQDRPKLDVPFIKTPPAVVERMLDFGQVSSKDTLIDLGSGDGRIPIAAAKNRGARGLGVDIDPARTQEAIAAARDAGVADKLAFRTENLFDTDLSKATVLTMYLFPEINLRLRPHLLKTLKPGTRVVSHAFHMDEWTPDRHDVVDGRDVFLWVIPARLEGLWRVNAPAGRGFTLRIWQQFQRVQAVAISPDEHSVPVADMKVDGRRLQFTLRTRDGDRKFSGQVDGDKIVADANNAETWSAERL